MSTSDTPEPVVGRRGDTRSDVTRSDVTRPGDTRHGDADRVGAGPVVTGGPEVQLPTPFGVFRAQVWTETATGVEHLSLSAGERCSTGDGQESGDTRALGDGQESGDTRALGDGQESGDTRTLGDGQESGAAPLVRLHSECLTGDVFGSFRCDCGEQLDQALALVNRDGGTVLYLRGQEGRGIGLADKLRAYSLQEAGADTVEANEQLGLPVDARDYQAAAAVLRELGLHTISLLTNNPAKEAALSALGIRIERLVSSEVPSRTENRKYLQTKRDRMNHRLLLAADYTDAPIRQS